MRISRISQTRRTIPNSTKQSPEESTRANNQLTRFGHNAYVLGAIKKEIYLLRRWLQLLAASLNARELQQNPAFRYLQNPRPKTRIYTNRFPKQKSSLPRMSVDRVVDRPLLPVDRSVDRVPNRELGIYSQSTRSTGRSTALWPCACCAHRSTDLLILWTVDWAGRPPRLFLLLLFFAACSFVCPLSTSLVITRRPLDDPCLHPWQ